MGKSYLSQSRKCNLNTSQRLEYIIIIIIIIITSFLLTAIEFSPGGSSHYTTRDRTLRMNIHKETIQKHSTHNTKHSKYKCTFVQ